MTLKTYIVITTSVLLHFPRLATAQGNLVINGGFDTDASSWTIANVDVSAGGGYLSNFGDPPGSVLLYNPSFSVFAPTASQEITSMTQGALYIVSGNYQKAGGKNVTDNSFGVSLDGVFLFETAAPADFNWHSFNFDYTATSTSTLLSLSAQINGTDYSYFIDNIAMYAVPEPSAWSLILLGSGVLPYVRRIFHR
jgi:hypothetical protein